jgi:Flp pilus assembly protein TadD
MAADLPARRLIPKWRPVRSTLATQEANPLNDKTTSARNVSAELEQASLSLSRSPGDLDEFDRVVALWERSKEPGVLGDILSFSIHAPFQSKVAAIGMRALREGHPVFPAQRFLIQQLANTGESALGVEIPSATSEGEPQPFAEPIRQLRSLLRTEPSNALALLDFAQLQAAIGRNDVAERALRTALGSAPNSRLILRTLARFYVHAGDHSRALQEIRRHQRTPHDPWLIASEIALADLAQKPSTLLAKGRRMLTEAGKAPPPSFTELAGALAMEELAAGNLKKAREFQRLALLEPTDNVAAQAVDREKHFGIALSAPNIARAIASSAEAQLLQSWSLLMPQTVERHALDWHAEEPFSSRPVQLLTSMYAYKGDHGAALRWLIAGLRSDSEDRGLLTNLAYVQARLGQLDDARLTIAKARRLHGPAAEPYLRATEGTIAYLQGRFEDGDKLYAEAVSLLDEGQNRVNNVPTFALLNQALMALEYEHPGAAAITARTNEALRSRPNSDANMLLRISMPKEIPTVASTSQPKRQRLTSQWVFDAKNNTLTVREGLTSPGASPIVLTEDSKKS